MTTSGRTWRHALVRAALPSLLLLGLAATAAKPTGRTAPAAAHAASAASAASAPSAAAPDVSMAIRIEPSRPQPFVGSGLGITAEFKNTSKTAVLYLAQESTTLTLPPEVEGPFRGVFGRDAFFPSENDQWRANNRREDEGLARLPVVIALQPGYSYRAIWALGTEPDKAGRMPPMPGPAPQASCGVWCALWRHLTGNEVWQQVGAELPYLFFAPGEYKALVQAKVGVGESPLNAGFHYYTVSETAVIKLAAPQSVIILGAMLGGLVSWLLFPQAQAKSVVLSATLAGFGAAARKAIWWLYSIAGACLLSAIVTVLLARLSDSQFLVKISANDFWGAMVIGFIAQYAGKSVLDKLIPGRAGAAKAAENGKVRGDGKGKGKDKPRPAAAGQPKPTGTRAEAPAHGARPSAAIVETDDAAARGAA